MWMPENYRVIFEPMGLSVTADSESTILEVAANREIPIRSDCGGKGLCGKCRVIVEQGQVDGGGGKRLSEQDEQEGFRLACQSRVISDLVVRVPVESAVDRSVLNVSNISRQTAKVRQFDLDELKEQGLFIPPIEKRYLELPEPSHEDNQADVTRLVNFLKATYDEHRLVVDLPVIRKIPDVLRSDHFKVTATLARPVQEGRKTRIINIQQGDTSSRNYAIAMDIGTTTIYGQLIDLIDGKVLGEYGDFNGQISNGKDVISRIVYAEKPDGLLKMHEVVVSTINNVIDELQAQS